MGLKDHSINRRDVLKLMGIFPATMAVTPLVKLIPSEVTSSENIIIIVFDAWSAKNLHMYGYKRQTMPNLEKFSEKAIVYHNHYASSNFTVPGTASILTGANPWEHRAFFLGGEVIPEFAHKQIFNVFQNTHNTIGFSQNIYADQLLIQSGSDIHDHVNFGRYNLNNDVFYDEKIFEKDQHSAFTSIENGIFPSNVDNKGSLFLDLIKEIYDKQNRKRIEEKFGVKYSSLLPASVEYYDLRQTINGFINKLEGMTTPSLVYFHFYTPHEPYAPYKNYYEKFSKDNFSPINKPIHPLIVDPFDKKIMEAERLKYDSYLASWDTELLRLFEFFTASGIRNKSHIFITSDHGEEFERGHVGHMQKMLYEPVIKVPLIVASPGISDRVDINSKTTNIDILPTLAHLTGKSIPNWASGKLLPGLGGEEDLKRKLFTLAAERSSPYSAIKEFSLSLHQENFKMIQYHHNEYQAIELYDLAIDPEELTNIYSTETDIAIQMENEMDDKMAEINKKWTS